MQNHRNFLQQVIWLITLTFTIPLWAQTDIPGPSFEEVISLRSAGSPEISPDGRSIVFGIRTVDWKKNGYDSEIWLVRNGEEPFQLTRTVDGSSWSPQWSPDGHWIAFIADRGNKNQIHLIRAYGGEAQPITDVKEGVNSFRWAPDGTKIAFTMTEKEKKEKKERKERYGEFAVEDKEYRYTHLWMVDVKPDPWPSPVEVPSYETEDSNDASNDDVDEPNVPDSNGVSLPKPKRLTEGNSYTDYGSLYLDILRRETCLVQGDLNGDCLVTMEDLSLFSMEWLKTSCGECGEADFSNNQNVELEDLEILLGNWMLDNYWFGLSI